MAEVYLIQIMQQCLDNKQYKLLNDYLDFVKNKWLYDNEKCKILLQFYIKNDYYYNNKQLNNDILQFLILNRDEFCDYIGENKEYLYLYENTTKLFSVA